MPNTEYDYEESDDDRLDESHPCGCTLCYCLNRTEYGEVCIECRTGSHQG